MENVELREIPGWPGYFVSRCGFVYSNRLPSKPMNKLKLASNGRGYLKINLCAKNKIKIESTAQE